jgi:hypothetical protein
MYASFRRQLHHTVTRVASTAASTTLYEDIEPTTKQARISESHTCHQQGLTPGACISP